MHTLEHWITTTHAASMHSSISQEVDTGLELYGALVLCWQLSGCIVPEKVQLIMKMPLSKSTEVPLR